MGTTSVLYDNIDDFKVRSAVTRLTLVNFRNYKYLRLNLSKPFVILYGENGSGKTNVLEALSFLSQGRGLRNAKLSEVKTFDFLANQQQVPTYINNNGWAVSAQVNRLDEEFVIGTAVETLSKETGYNEVKEFERRIVHVNNQKLPSQNDLGNYVSLIWITPQMDRLFLGGAQNRRHFLDRIVCAFDVDHARRLSSFDNLYRQWMQILKSGNINNNWLLSLEERLSEFAVAIAAARRDMVEKLNNFISNNPDDIFPDALLSLDGTAERMLDEKPAIFVEDYYKESLFKMRRNILYSDSEDCIIKTDLNVLYKKKNIPAELCSTGEQKSLLLNIVLAQAKSLLKTKNFPPILLLDEVAAHLDNDKRHALLSKIKNLRTQTWLTTTSPFDFSDISDDAQFFEVKNNAIQEN